MWLRPSLHPDFGRLLFSNIRGQGRVEIRVNPTGRKGINAYLYFGEVLGRGSHEHIGGRFR